MGTPDLKVDPEALRRFTGKARASAKAVDELLARMNRIKVGSLAFGQFPAGRKLHEAYDTIADACREGVGDTSAAFNDIADGVSSEAEQYDATEIANRDMFRAGGTA